jgi:hypothetical protein
VTTDAAIFVALRLRQPARARAGTTTADRRAGGASSAVNPGMLISLSSRLSNVGSFLAGSDAESATRRSRAVGAPFDPWLLIPPATALEGPARVDAPCRCRLPEPEVATGTRAFPVITPRRWTIDLRLEAFAAARPESAGIAPVWARVPEVASADDGLRRDAIDRARLHRRPGVRGVHRRRWWQLRRRWWRLRMRAGCALVGTRAQARVEVPDVAVVTGGGAVRVALVIGLTRRACGRSREHDETVLPAVSGSFRCESGDRHDGSP